MKHLHTYTLTHLHIYTFICLMIFGFSTNSIGQECDDLMISEILFQSTSQTISGESTGNYSIEIYNPTNSEIVLDEYNIVLKKSNQDVILNLSGILGHAETYVISSLSNVPIPNTDIYNSDLNFLEVEVIRLRKNLKVLDEFGEIGLGDSWDSIDFDELLNNPEDVDFSKINARSIQFLTLRRNKSIKKGNTSFSSSEFVNEWFIYPALDVSNIGYYFCSCTSAVAYWEGVSTFIPEETFDESQGSNAPHSIEGALQWADASIRLENNTEGTTCHIWDSGDYFEYFNDDDKADDLDYGIKFGDWPDDGNEIYFAPNQSFKNFTKFTWAVNDLNSIEGNEGYGLNLVCSSSGQIVDDPDRDVVDYRIVLLVSTMTNNIKDIKCYPTITNAFINISMDNFKEGLIKIYDMSGRRFFETELKHNHQQIDVSSLPINGIYIIQLVFDNGYATRKFYKY